MGDAATADMENGKKVVLLAEDDRELRRLLAGSLRLDGHEVEEVSDGFALRDRLERDPLPDFLVADVRMPGFNGLEVIQLLRWKERPLPPFAMITAFGDETIHESAAGLGAVATLDKPFDVDELRELVKRSLPQRSP